MLWWGCVGACCPMGRLHGALLSARRLGQETWPVCADACVLLRRLAMKTFSSSRLAQGAATGQWSFWKTSARDVMDSFIGINTDIVPSVIGNDASDLQACQRACMNERLCAGVVFGPATRRRNPGAGSIIKLKPIGNSNAWGSDIRQYWTGSYAKACYIIKGVVDSTTNTPKRTFVRAKPSNFALDYCPPSTYRARNGTCVGCPLGKFSADTNAPACKRADAATCPAPWRGTINKFKCGCPAGYAMKPDNSSCERCPDGSW